MTKRGRPRAAKIAAHILGVAGAALLCGQAASASSVLPVSVGEMLDHSELVFEGRAVGRRISETGGPDGIQTCVRFEVVDVLKGPDVSSPLELCFAGGRSRYGMTRHVEGVDAPRLGEHGIYFVNSLSAPTIHPFYGWEQGRFRVALKSGAVETAGGEVVVGLDADAPEAAAPEAARGARVALRGARSSEPPMDAAAFKARLREIMAEEGN